MKIKECYNKAEEFFELIKEILSLKLNDESSLYIKCNFILYFILLESKNLPYNYNLFVESIEDCTIALENSSVWITFRSTTNSSFNFHIFLKDLENYIKEGIDFRGLENEPAILTINKESTLYRLNKLRINNIKELLRDIKTVENHFSTDVKKILEVC